MTKGYSHGTTKLILAALKSEADKGKTRKEAAETLGLSYLTVCKYAADYNIAFRQRVYEFSETQPHNDGGRCQFAVRLRRDTYAYLVEEAKSRGLSVGVAARVIFEEMFHPSSQEAAE